MVLPSLFEEDLAEETREVEALLATGATGGEARAGYGAGAPPTSRSSSRPRRACPSHDRQPQRHLARRLGPNTGGGSTSVVLMIEAQVEYLLRVLAFMRAAGMATVEPRPGAQRAYVAEVDARMRPTVWSAGGRASWYMDRTGRVSASWPGLASALRRRIRRFDPALHVATPRRPAAAPAGSRIWSTCPGRPGPPWLRSPTRSGPCWPVPGRSRARLRPAADGPTRMLASGACPVPWSWTAHATCGCPSSRRGRFGRARPACARG